MKGFSLLEFLIYFGLTTLLVTLVLQWATMTHSWIYSQAESSGTVLVYDAAHDVLVHDLRTLVDWKGMHDGWFVWSTGDGDRAWRVINGKLVRMQGVFHESGAAWSEATRSLVAENTETLSIEPCYKNGLLCGTRSVLRAGNNAYVSSRLVARHNGARV